MQHTLWFVVIVVLVYAPASAAEVQARDGIVVRIYDAAALESSAKQSALATAGEILRAAGVHIDWMACDRTGGDTNALCEVPVGAHELVVRFLRLPAPDPRREVPLGHSLVDTGARGGLLATIFVDRIVRFTEGCATATPIVVGRAIAHEIGHLLLGHSRHAHEGLMRAQWTTTSLRVNREEDWRFTRDDVRQLRRALSARQRVEVVLKTLE